MIGLSTEEALARLSKDGPNFVDVKHPNKLVQFLYKFLAPIPFVLEATIILELVLHKYDEAVIVSFLLIFNAVLGFFQEDKANKAIAILQKSLMIQARVFRDGKWQLIDSKNLVKGDLIHLRMGDISPADIKLGSGELLIDQSSLTGESIPVERKEGDFAYSASIVKKGEASGIVIATGKNTYFGKTISLMQTASVTSHIKDVIFKLMKYLFIFVMLLAIILVMYAGVEKLTFLDLAPYFLILLLASIPVALPATFTLATALGAVSLVKNGVLVTRLSALEEASSLDILCVDKTGTLTKNELELTEVYPLHSYSKDHLLRYASIASDESSQDPIDQAIFTATNAIAANPSSLNLIKFIPFDPANKFTEALCREDNCAISIIKGSVDIIQSKSVPAPELEEQVRIMGEKGYRLLAVAYKKQDNALYTIIGLIGFYDPPREDSFSSIKAINALGVRTIMLTGDNVATANTIAKLVGLGGKICSLDLLKHPAENQVLDCNVFANLYPEEKYLLVKMLQNAGHIIGMTGDGINDAPSLKQADVGIAVSNAGDATKSAASIVLTRPGLNGILSTIETSRKIFQRMQTYVINKVSKSIEVTVFVTLGVILTGETILTPFLMVLLMFSNDFATMSIATDNASYSKIPESWKVGKLMASGILIGAFTLTLSFSVFLYAKNILNLTLPELQTLIFLLLAFTAQTNIYLIRERRFFWNSMPSKWLILSSVFSIIILSIMAEKGILMTPIPGNLIVYLLALICIYSVIIGLVKTRLFSILRLT